MKKCATPSCPNEAFYKIGICKNCYSANYYANKKGVRWQHERRVKLRIYDERLDMISPSNVVMLRRRKRA